MLLDPLEEQFHLPSVAIEVGNGHCWDGEIVARKVECLPGFPIPILHPAQRLRVVFLRVRAGQDDRLIAQAPVDFSNGAGISATVFGVGLRPE